MATPIGDHGDRDHVYDVDPESPIAVASLFMGAVELWPNDEPRVLSRIPNTDLLEFLIEPGLPIQFLADAQRQLAATNGLSTTARYPAPNIAYVVCPHRAELDYPDTHEVINQSTPVLAEIITLVYERTWPLFQWRVFAVGDYVLPEHIHRVEGSELS